jgi:transposase
MDLYTRKYMALESYMESEMKAYDRANNFLSSTGIEMDSIRLDRYYSSLSRMS